MKVFSGLFVFIFTVVCVMFSIAYADLSPDRIIYPGDGVYYDVSTPESDFELFYIKDEPVTYCKMYVDIESKTPNFFASNEDGSLRISSAATMIWIKGHCGLILKDTDGEILAWTYAPAISCTYGNTSHLDREVDVNKYAEVWYDWASTPSCFVSNEGPITIPVVGPDYY